MLLVAGSYTVKTEPGIYLYRFDAETQNCDLLKIVLGIENPSYIAVSAKGNKLFAVRESKTGDQGQLSAYLLDKNNINFQGDIKFTGAGSCYVSTDKRDKHAFVANYQAGTLAIFKLSNGVPTALAQLIEFTGNGPNPERQDRSHIHAVILSPDQRFLYCTDLGADRLYQFHYNGNNEQPLNPCDPPYTSLPPGSGPRHLTFDDTGHWLYVLSELSGEIFKFSSKKALKNWSEKISIVSNDYSGPIEAADIVLHPSGKFLYASHRGKANEIIVFRIDRRNGGLKFIQRLGAEGSSPRSIAVSNNGKTLFVANEQSNNITIFRIASNGRLKYTGNELKLNQPTCVKLLDD